jgi:hypothetical protein
MPGSSCFETHPFAGSNFHLILILAKVFPAMKDHPALMLVVFALSFSMRIAEQIRAGNSDIPQRPTVCWDKPWVSPARNRYFAAADVVSVTSSP